MINTNMNITQKQPMNWSTRVKIFINWMMNRYRRAKTLKM